MKQGTGISASVGAGWTPTDARNTVATGGTSEAKVGLLKNPRYRTAQTAFTQGGWLAPTF